MTHLPLFLYDLALILCTAGIISLLFKLLKQPVVLGYILAGLLVGPNFDWFPDIGEKEGVQIWAEIGVIFLLFGLGLEFSFKKMIRTGKIVGFTAVMEVLLTMLTGYVAGSLMGWKEMDCLFFGGILAIASTTIIIRSYEELDVKSKNFAGLVTGILIIEDLVAVILMVLLTTLSVGSAFEGTEMVYSILKLVFFLVLWFVGGIFFIPTILRKTKKYLSDETLLIFSVSLCMLMVVLAHKAGFSPALGAFIMGSILAETNKGEKIGHLISPLKNIFGAVFFVSVGMLIDLEIIYEYYFSILVGVLILLFAKPIFVIGGSLISGQTLKTSVQSGMSLSQIGEFSFIIASLGLSLGVIGEHLYPIAVAVSVITTFTTPFMIRLSPSVNTFLERKLPVKWQESLLRYGTGTQKVRETNEWNQYIRNTISNVLIFSVIILFILFIGNRLISDFLTGYEWEKLLSISIILAAMAPFLWAVSFRGVKLKLKEERWPRLQKGPLAAILFLRIALTILFIGMAFETVFSTITAIIGVFITLIILFILRQPLRKYYHQIEKRFFHNLHAKEQEKEMGHLVPWDSQIATFDMNPVLPFIGKTLNEIALREKFGINIASIKRGEAVINVPGRNEKIFPSDIVSVIGTEMQITKFREFIEAEIKNHPLAEQMHEITLTHFSISENSPLDGKSIRQTEIRELTHGLVVGVERNGNRILNPESDFIFEANDSVWLVGDEKRVQVFLQKV